MRVSSVMGKVAVTNGAKKDFITYLTNDDNVYSIYLLTGDHNILFMARFKDNEKLAAFISKIEEIEGVKDVTVSIVLNTLKETS